MEEKDDKKILTPMRSIRAKCLDCSCGSANEVSLCPITDCALYPYRFGKSPDGKGRKVSEERKIIARERMLAYHAKKKADMGDRGLPE